MKCMLFSHFLFDGHCSNVTCVKNHPTNFSGANRHIVWLSQELKTDCDFIIYLHEFHSILRDGEIISTSVVVHFQHRQVLKEEMNLQRKRATTGRPVGTDGSDYSYRMTVDPKYTKVAEGKARLKVIIILQAAFQLLGPLYMFIFPVQAVEIDALAAFAVCSGVIFYTLGELGRRGSKVVFLKGYRWFSPIVTLLAVIAVLTRSLHLREIKDSNVDTVLTGITFVDLLFYVHILVGVVVELFQVHTTKNLLRNMTPSID